MRRYLLTLMLMLVSTCAYAQTNMNGTSGCPSTPPYNDAVCWSTASHLWQYGVSGAWTNQAGSGGATPVGGNGTIQTSNGAGALAAYAGSSCTNQVGIGLSALGAETCHTVTTTDTDTTIAKTGADINTSNQVTVTHLASPQTVAQGGTGAGTFTQFSLLYGNGTSAFGTLLLINDQMVIGNTGSAPTALTLPSAGCTSTQSLNYTHAGGWACQAITATAAAQGTTGAIQYNSSGSLAGLNGTGLVKLNGASAPTVATAGVAGDYSAGYVTVGASLSLLSMGGLI